MKSLSIIKTIAMFVVSASLLTACSLVELDDPGPTAPVEAPTDLPLTEEAFRMALSTNDSSRTWSALTFELEGLRGFQFCRLDDTFTFFSNGTYRYDGGEVLCGGEDDTRIKTGIWELDFPDARIIFDRETSKEYRATVAGLDSARIQLLGQVEIFGQAFDIEGIYESKQ